MTAILRTFRNIVTALIVGSFLAACTSFGTNEVYRSELQLSSNVYRINVIGLRSVPHQRVKDFALLRASEIVLARGEKRFVILGEEIERISQEVTTDSILLSTTTLPDGSIETTYSPEETRTRVNSQGTLTIEIVRSSDSRYGSAHDAQLIANQLRPLLLPDENT